MRACLCVILLAWHADDLAFGGSVWTVVIKMLSGHKTLWKK